MNKTCPCGDTASFWRTLSWSLTCPFQFASFQIHPDSHQYLFSSSPPHWCPVFSNSMGSSLYGYSSTLTSPNCPQGIHIVVPSWVPCHSPEDSQVSLGLRVWFSSGDPQSPLAKLLPPHSKKKKKKVQTSKTTNATATDTALSFLFVVFKRIWVGFHSAVMPCIIMAPFPPDSALGLFELRYADVLCAHSLSLPSLGKGHL